MEPFRGPTKLLVFGTKCVLTYSSSTIVQRDHLSVLCHASKRRGETSVRSVHELRGKRNWKGGGRGRGTVDQSGIASLHVVFVFFVCRSVFFLGGREVRISSTAHVSVAERGRSTRGSSTLLMVAAVYDCAPLGEF